MKTDIPAIDYSCTAVFMWLPKTGYAKALRVVQLYMLFAQPPWGNVLKKSKPTFRPARPEIFGLLGEVKSDFP